MDENDTAGVPSSCVVYMATTDGVLRMCHLANFKQPPLAKDPEPLPAALPVELAAALEAAGRLEGVDEVGDTFNPLTHIYCSLSAHSCCCLAYVSLLEQWYKRIQCLSNASSALSNTQLVVPPVPCLNTLACTILKVPSALGNRCCVLCFAGV